MSDAAEANAGTEIAGEVETKAREMGWKPKDEWEGDDTGWMEAEAFIERQENLTKRADAAAQAENRKLREEIASLKGVQAEMRQTMDEFREFHSKTEQRAYDRALKDIQTKQRQAVESGDTEAFDAAAAEADALMKDAAASAPAGKKPDQPQNPDDIPAFKDWHAKNDWYLDDVKLTAYAESIAPAIARKGGYNGTEAAYYEAITEEVKAEFPDRFENPNRKKAAAVESSGGAAPRKKGRSYTDLPPEAKAQCDKYVKQGLLTKEQYVKDYDWSE